MDGQINIFDYLSQISAILFGGCGKCVCKKCLYHHSGRCPYGGCFDNKRAIENPYNEVHQNEPLRTSWSNWKTDQAYWCRGGIFYPVQQCKEFIKYMGCECKDCIKCVVTVFQDGYIDCSLVDSVGCEVCYKEFKENYIERGYYD